MDENVRLAYLFDIYGDLLSEHQRRIFEAVRFSDLSFSEVADNFDTSRQAAHDVYRRTVDKLEHYEDTLHLLTKYVKIKRKTERIIELSKEGEEALDQIGTLAREVIGEL